MIRIAAILVAVLASTAFAQGTPAGKPQPLDKAFAPLQGTWVINDINGQAAPPMLLVFKGDQYEQHVNDAVVERGTIKLNARQKPTTIDLVITEGQDANKLQVGIVEVTADKMRLKLAPAGNTTRPKSFDSEQDMLLVNLTKQR